MEEIKYSGYYCSKCNFIPLIKIIQKNNNIKVFSSCKCHNQYENIESFLKHKYKKDIININKINKESPNNYHNTLSFEKENLESIIQKFNKEKIKVLEQGINIKNQLIELFQKKIEEVNQMYLKYSEKNNKIIVIIEQLIQSYELLKDNKSNILNILNNCKWKENLKINYFERYKNLETLTKDIENYFCNKYIVSNLDISESLENIYSYYSPNKIKSFVELNDEICAFNSEYNNKITLLNLNKFNKEFFTFKAYDNNIEYIIKSSVNNIISIGDNNIIKIWPKFERNMLSEVRNKNINNEDNKTINYKEKEYSFNLNPLIEYNIEIKENVIKLISLKENRFLIALKSNIILLFKYSINNIEIIQKYEYKNHNYFNDIFVFESEIVEMIAVNDNSNIYFFELENFRFIKSIPLKFIDKNNLIQINSKEILIGDGYNFHIIILNFLNTKLTMKNQEKKLYLLNLNDGTFIQSTGDKIKRYFIKTMEELPLLEQNDNYEDNYDDTLDYNNYNDDIIYYLYKLNDGRIVTFHNNGRFEIGYLKYN